MTIFQRLQQVRQLTGIQVNAGIITQVEASVTVTTPTPQTVIFSEKGTRYTETGAIITFSNSYQWFIINDCCLSLAHLRHAEPVNLVRLIRHNNHCFKNESPYYCGDDIYQATLLVKEDAIHLKWLIMGPNKAIDIDIRYC